SFNQNSCFPGDVGECVIAVVSVELVGRLSLAVDTPWTQVVAVEFFEPVVEQVHVQVAVLVVIKKRGHGAIRTVSQPIRFTHLAKCGHAILDTLIDEQYVLTPLRRADSAYAEINIIKTVAVDVSHRDTGD